MSYLLISNALSKIMLLIEVPSICIINEFTSCFVRHHWQFDDCLANTKLTKLKQETPENTFTLINNSHSPTFYYTGDIPIRHYVSAAKITEAKPANKLIPSQLSSFKDHFMRHIPLSLSFKTHLDHISLTIYSKHVQGNMENFLRRQLQEHSVNLKKTKQGFGYLKDTCHIFGREILWMWYRCWLCVNILYTILTIGRYISHYPPGSS